jgi:mono/diheme cytochrome c family protein
MTMKTKLVAIAMLAVACGTTEDPPTVIKPELRKFPLDPIVQADRALAPIDGGTLHVTRDGTLAVAADPDRDRVSIVDLVRGAVAATYTLRDGDDPGRVTEDAGGNLYVVLRGAGAVASFDRDGTERFRAPVCPAPQGIDFDESAGLYVACDTGELVTLGTDGLVLRSVRVERDLRDVVAAGDGLYVSRFRSAEILRLDPEGAIAERLTLPEIQGMVASVAWRMVESGSGVLVVHQRARASGVGVGPSAYGGNCAGPIVQTAVTRIEAGGVLTTTNLRGVVLPVDVGTNGTVVALAAAGARTVLEDPHALTFSTDGLVGVDIAASALDGASERGLGDCLGFGGITRPAAIAMPETAPESQVVAVGFANGALVLQSRSPAALYLADGRTVALASDELRDTGHELFHLDAGVGLACASCHPGGREDGVTWQFADVGIRRTQDLRGGILGSEPFHWSGDMADFHVLANEVFGSRMGGPELPDEYVDTLADFIDAIPPPAPAIAVDPEAAARGEALFRDATTKCASCHEANMPASVDVGTGELLQVPSLAGVGSRTPLLHHGCAATLRDRFGTCGGGDLHGVTSHLDDAQIDDLVAYLETL